MVDGSVSQNSSFGPIAIAIYQTLESYGVDAAKLMRDAGVDLTHLKDPTARLDPAVHRKIVASAVELTEDQGFGLRFSDFVHPTTFHALGFALLSSSTLRAFCQRWVRYHSFITITGEISIDELGKTMPCVIHQDTDYGHENLDAVVDQAAEMKIDVAATAAHKPTETEFTATVLRLRNAGCDVVFMGTVYRDTVLILEAARKMGWDDVSFVGNDVTCGDVVAKVQSGASEGFSAFGHIAELYRDDDLSDEVAAWYDRFEERFGEKPVVAAVEGYRGADIIVTAFERAGEDLTHDSLIAPMESITDYEDMFGYKLSFGPDDHKGVSESVLSVVENGRWVTKAESVSY